MGKHEAEENSSPDQLSAFLVVPPPYGELVKEESPGLGIEGPRGVPTPPASGSTSLENIISREVEKCLVKMLDELAGQNPETMLGEMRLWADDYMQEHFGRGLNER